MATVTIRQLLEAGVHFGHQTRRWNPKMRRFIFGERNGIYILDLEQSLSGIDAAYRFIRETAASGGTVLFIGTKKQAQEPIEREAKRVGMPFVNQRWLGGMLTNFQTISKRLARIRELEAMEDVGTFELLPKKEVLRMRKEKESLLRNLGGIREMTKLPSAVWIIDTKKEHIAVREARKAGIPVVAIVDSNCDPEEIDFPIPGNDDAIRSCALLTRIIANAVAEGHGVRTGDVTTPDAPAAAIDEDMPEWERQLKEQEAAERERARTEAEELRSLR
jgi:small subunit ribosomal protein S2